MTFDIKEKRDENYIGKLIKEQRTFLNIKQKTFTKMLEEHGIFLKQAAVSKWEEGETVPNAYQFIAICEILNLPFSNENLEANTRLNAEGNSKIREYTRDLIASGNYEPITKNTIRNTEVKLFNLPVSAGCGLYLDDDASEFVSVPSSIVPKETDYALKVCGNSMEPRYFDGSYVFIKKTEIINPGDIGVFVYCGEAYLKIFDYTKGENPIPVLISINPEYAPIPIEAEDEFHILGRALK